MTLILGARCIDGVVLVADGKFTSEEAKPDYGNKITGEIPGLLTAFSGDRATFEEFTNRLRSLLTTRILNQVKESLEKKIPIVGLGIRFDDLIWEINVLQHDLRAAIRSQVLQVIPTQGLSITMHLGQVLLQETVMMTSF